jgi:hypothetical protein
MCEVDRGVAFTVELSMVDRGRSETQAPNWASRLLKARERMVKS